MDITDKKKLLERLVMSLVCKTKCRRNTPCVDNGTCNYVNPIVHALRGVFMDIENPIRDEIGALLNGFHEDN